MGLRRRRREPPARLQGALGRLDRHAAVGRNARLPLKGPVQSGRPPRRLRPTTAAFFFFFRKRERQWKWRGPVPFQHRVHAPRGARAAVHEALRERRRGGVWTRRGGGRGGELGRPVRAHHADALECERGAEREGGAEAQV